MVETKFLTISLRHKPSFIALNLLIYSSLPFIGHLHPMGFIHSYAFASSQTWLKYINSNSLSVDLCQRCASTLLIT